MTTYSKTIIFNLKYKQKKKTTNTKPIGVLIVIVIMTYYKSWGNENKLNLKLFNKSR